jgi:hypothetical protein
LLLATTGCQRALAPGSAYRASGHYFDLLAEPTFDVHGNPPQGFFYDTTVPHFDADGHHVFDIPVVFCEQLLFAPTWLFSGVLWLTDTEGDLAAPWPSLQAISEVPGAAVLAVRKIVSASLSLGRGVFFGLGFTATMVFDTAIHDLPVIATGLPFRLVTFILGPPY